MQENNFLSYVSLALVFLQLHFYTFYTILEDKSNFGEFWLQFTYLKVCFYI